MVTASRQCNTNYIVVGVELDSNYAGILIIWDRLFGTFVPEDKDAACRYGIVRQIASFNPLIIAFHEWAGIASDLLRAKSLRAAFMYVFGPPGWSEDGSRLTSQMIKARERARISGRESL